MKFTGQEFALMDLALKTTEEMTTGILSNGNTVPIPKERKFKNDELLMVIRIHDKFNKHLKKENGIDVYKDGEIDLDVTERAFLLKLCDREWTEQQGRHYVTLKETLNTVEGKAEDEKEKKKTTTKTHQK